LSPILNLNFFYARFPPPLSHLLTVLILYLLFLEPPAKEECYFTSGEKSKYGCCWDGRTARDPNNHGCPGILKLDSPVPKPIKNENGNECQVSSLGKKKKKYMVLGKSNAEEN